MYTLTHVQEGLRIFRRSVQRRHHTQRYSGDAEAICAAIIERCWNTHDLYFMASAGHFCEFYTRDFGWCVKALLDLGHRRRVRQTLQYALERFSKAGRIRVAITPSGKPFDLPTYGIDSVPMLIHSLVALGDHTLIKTYEPFLQSEINLLAQNVDAVSGLVRTDRAYSSMRDHAKRTGTCYDNLMIAMISKDLRAIPSLHNPFKKPDYHYLIQKHFWNGSWFCGDMGTRQWSSEANIMAFWTGVFTEQQRFNSVLREIKKMRLDRPFPLKYEDRPLQRRSLVSALAPNYKGTTLWAHLAMLYLDVLAEYNHREFRKQLKTYSKVIERYKTFYEVYTPEGKPFNTVLYNTDEGMLWSAGLLSHMHHT